MDFEFNQTGAGARSGAPRSTEFLFVGCELSLFLPRHIRQEFTVARDADCLDEAIVKVVELPVDLIDIPLCLNLHLYWQND